MLGSRASTKEGTLQLEWTSRAPWPATKLAILLDQKLRDGRAVLAVQPSGKIRFHVKHSNGNVLIVRDTPRLHIDEGMDVVIGVGWSLPDNVNLVINGMVLCDGTMVAISDRTVVIPPRVRPSPPTTNYENENQAAISERRAKRSAGVPKTGRIPGDDQRVRAALEAEVQQIADLLNLVKAGNVSHARGLAARLRLLIAWPKMTLLQMFAAAHDLPLLVAISDRVSRGPTPAFSVDFEVMNHPGRGRCDIPIDLDVWLDLPRMPSEQKILSHRDVLRSIGDTIGAHFDRDIDPVVDHLQAMKSELSGVAFEALVQYLVHVAGVALELSRGALTKTTAIN